MGRPAGSKNKKIEEIISDVAELGLDTIQTQEAISELEDLLEPEQPASKKLIGYNPITGCEIWE
jgi:hypothetical protein